MPYCYIRQNTNSETFFYRLDMAVQHTCRDDEMGETTIAWWEDDG